MEFVLGAKHERLVLLQTNAAEAPACRFEKV